MPLSAPAREAALLVVNRNTKDCTEIWEFGQLGAADLWLAGNDETCTAAGRPASRNPRCGSLLLGVDSIVERSTYSGSRPFLVLIN